MNSKFYITALLVLLSIRPDSYAQTTLTANKKETKQVLKITKKKSVRLALKIIDDIDDRTIEDMITLTEIPAPPFKESLRANKFVEMLTNAGVDSIWVDKEGNVLALRKGTKGTKNVVLDAHMDTVFPIETDVTVKVTGNKYSAPGIGDNTRGMAMLIAVLKAMNKANIKTEENIYFVGTVGEEGLGDLRGVKYLFSHKSAIKIDSWISIDGGSSGRIINGGLGSKRYKAVFKGKGGHSWGAFGLANPHHALGNAIKLFITEANEYTNGEGPKTSYNVGRIGGGTSVNSIPFESWMEVDMRSLSPKRLLEIDSVFKHTMQKAVVEYNSSGIKDNIILELIPIGDRPSGVSPENTPLVQRAIASAQYVGIKPALKTSSTNSNIPISKNIPAITLSRGGKGSRAHALDEKWTNINGSKNIKLALLVVLSEAGIAK